MVGCACACAQHSYAKESSDSNTMHPLFWPDCEILMCVSLAKCDTSARCAAVSIHQSINVCYGEPAAVAAALLIRVCCPAGLPD